MKLPLSDLDHIFLVIQITRLESARRNGTKSSWRVPTTTSGNLFPSQISRDHLLKSSRVIINRTLSHLKQQIYPSFVIGELIPVVIKT